MATRNVVPRGDLEGHLGTGEKRWGAVYAGNVNSTYVNVAAMVADTNLKVGTAAATQGYYAAGDGGHGFYTIRDKVVADVDDGGSVIFLANGKVAELIVNDAVSVKQFGAKGDGVTDDTTAFQKSSAMEKVFIPKGSYLITDNVIFNNKVVSEGTFTDYAPLFSVPNLLQTLDRFVPYGNGQYNFGYLNQAYVECMAYNTNTQKLILGLYRFSPSNKCVFLTLDKDTLAIEDTVEVNEILGINALTYDPFNNVYYARIRGTFGNKFYSINADDLTDITVIADAAVLGHDIPYYMWIPDEKSKTIIELKYVNNLSYAADIYDKTHTTLLKTVQFPDNIRVDDWTQDVAIKDGKIYTATQDDILELDVCTGQANRIAANGGNETEALESFDGKLFIGFHNAFSNGVESIYEYSQDITAQNYEKMNGSDVHSTLDVDLNFYLVSGKYICDSADTTGKNYPTGESKGFLIIDANTRLGQDNNLTYINQTFCSLVSPYHKYTRTYYRGTGIWSNWICCEDINSQGANYIRYESGIQLCWGTKGVTTYENMGGAYPYRGAVSENYPLPYTQTPSVFANVQDSINYWVGNARNIYLSYFDIMIAGNQNNETRMVNWYAIGYWK